MWETNETLLTGIEAPPLNDFLRDVSYFDDINDAYFAIGLA